MKECCLKLLGHVHTRPKTTLSVNLPLATLFEFSFALIDANDGVRRDSFKLRVELGMFKKGLNRGEQ